MACSRCSWGLEDGDDALAGGRADADHATSGATLVQRLGEGGHDSSTGGGERMPGGKRASVDVEPLTVDRTQRLAALQTLAAEHRILPGAQRAKNLGGERLVDLVEVK